MAGRALQGDARGELCVWCPWLADSLQETERLSDIELLKSYARQWDRYTTGATYVNKLFNYLNKHWVKREKDEGRKEVYTVYTVRTYTHENHSLTESWRWSRGKQISSSICRRMLARADSLKRY